MEEASHLEGSEVGSSGEGSCWATYDWHQTESHLTNQKSPGTYWRPEGHKQCMAADRGRCCSMCCRRWTGQEVLEVQALAGARVHRCLGQHLASCP